MAGGPFLPAPCWQASARKLRAGRRATRAERAVGYCPEHPCCPGQGRGAGPLPRPGGERTGREMVPPAACQCGDRRAVMIAPSCFAVVLEHVVECQAPFQVGSKRWEAGQT